MVLNRSKTSVGISDGITLSFDKVKSIKKKKNFINGGRIVAEEIRKAAV